MAPKERRALHSNSLAPAPPPRGMPGTGGGARGLRRQRRTDTALAVNAAPPPPAPAARARAPRPPRSPRAPDPTAANGERGGGGGREGRRERERGKCHPEPGPAGERWRVRDVCGREGAREREREGERDLRWPRELVKQKSDQVVFSTAAMNFNLELKKTHQMERQYGAGREAEIFMMGSHDFVCPVENHQPGSKEQKLVILFSIFW
uniref:cuticle collagen 2C-like n=1 Tax=Lonchura striata TaxID=40157 RepID=UPI00129337BE|nr:cuticle collagen 2C-like [Lonchura striata domestica]